MRIEVKKPRLDFQFQLITNLYVELKSDSEFAEGLKTHF